MSVKGIFKKRPQSIMQAYKIAIQEAKQAKSYDEKIAAYGKVINYCGSNWECRYDPGIKRQVLMRWAYGKIAEAYWYKKDADKALNFYESSFNLARNLSEQNATLEKMGEIYRQVGKMDKWFQVKEKLTGYLDKNDKRAAYLFLAQEAVEEDKAAEYLEQALQAIGKEEGSLGERTQKILDVSARLMTLYRLRKDENNLRRVEKLRKKIEELYYKIKDNHS